MTVSWQDIENMVGRDAGEFDAPCPVCGPDRRHGSNKVRKVLRIWRSEPGFATYFCARCGLSGWVRPDDAGRVQKRGKVYHALFTPAAKEAREADERQRRDRAAFAEFTYISADPVTGTLAETYLKRRGVTATGDLRFAPFAPFAYEGERTGPALVGAVRDATGAIAGAHVTHFNPDGSKLRRTCFGRVGGGAVRLAPVGEAGELAVAEGIETALSFAALYSVPTWAALSAGGIEQFEPPAGLRRLVVAADNDASGRGLEAAQRLAKRISDALEVVVSLPRRAGDWNDIIQREAA